jgi:hypothetical protein
MTIGEAQRTIAYQGIVENLLALRDEARDNNHGEIKAINQILASVMSLQLIDRFSRMPTAGTRNSIEPVLQGTTKRASKKAPPFLTKKPPMVSPLAELVPKWARIGGHVLWTPEAEGVEEGAATGPHLSSLLVLCEYYSFGFHMIWRITTATIDATMKPARTYHPIMDYPPLPISNHTSFALDVWNHAEQGMRRGNGSLSHKYAPHYYLGLKG